VKWWFLIVPVLLICISVAIVWPAFGVSAPSWMGSADGFVLAKARFLMQGLGLGSWNRYWFLGIPGQQIGSPVIPWVLSLIIGLIGLDPVSQPGEFFRLWRSMVAVGVVGSVVGIWWFARGLLLSTSRVKNEDTSEVLFFSFFVTLFVLLMPSVLVFFPQIWSVISKFGWPSWMMFSPFYLGDGNKSLTFGFVLLAALLAWRLIQKWNLRQAVVLSFLVGLMLLIDSLSFLTFFLWLIALLLVAIVQPRLRKVSIIVQATRLLSICFFGFILVGFWFTPGYIYTFLGAPSLGGRPFTVVVINLIRRLLVLVPAIFGVIAARRWLKKSPTLAVVGLLGLLVFGSLTLAAFIADPDFWQDYSRFGRSLDLSLALLVGGVISKSKCKCKSKRWMVVLAILILGFPFLFHRKDLLRGAVGLQETAEYRVGSELKRLIQSSCGLKSNCPIRVYLSGSSVFWFNGWFDVVQVRGGGEMGSVNDWWPHASFQIREGTNPELAEEWLEVLGVSYLAVHGLESEEVYHDFRFPSKFELMKGWEKVWEEKGDVIYSKSPSTELGINPSTSLRINKSDNPPSPKASEEHKEAVASIARVVDLEILELAPPHKGDDLVALQRYTGELGAEAKFDWLGKRELLTFAELGDGEGIRLAVSYSPFWKVSETSIPIEIEKDPLGMIVVRPKETRLRDTSARQEGLLTARLRFNPMVDLVGGVLITIVGLYVLLRKPQMIERLAQFAERFVGRESELDRTAL
jgi:hypothetical protein